LHPDRHRGRPPLPYLWVLRWQPEQGPTMLLEQVKVEGSGSLMGGGRALLVIRGSLFRGRGGHSAVNVTGGGRAGQRAVAERTGREGKSRMVRAVSGRQWLQARTPEARRQASSRPTGPRRLPAA
jgi:hypothetical protein